MTYAPESGSVKELDRIKKRIKLQNVLRSMRACYTRQIEVKANIVMGFPGQTFRDLLDTLYFIARMAVVGTRDIMIYTFCPYPGSELYRELRAEGRLPEPSDEHFYSLISQMDFSRSVSFNQGFSDRQLNLARFTGMLLFYIVCFLVRPWRLVQSAYRMWTGRYETYFEDRLSSFVKRMLTVGAKETEAGGRPPQPETDRAVRPKR
jgi:radical SAM superfamily enzyme YgiQ (UPF0313 family)